MSNLNKVMIIGRLGKDIELKKNNNDKSVALLSVATNDVYIDATGKEKRKVDWHRVVVWNKQAENCAEYLHKGSLVYIEGKLQTREWEDENKQKRYMTEVIAQNVRFLSGNNNKSDPIQEEIPF